MKPKFLFLPCLVLASLLCSCSGFRGAYRKALAQPVADSFTGAWSGTWKSSATGHHGTLQCVISPADDAGHHRFHYRATWQKILSGSFVTVHEVKPAGGGKWTFSGDSDLGPLAGGVYHHEGMVTTGSFEATYKSKMDEGIFSLSRPSP